jgi:hypothetical protein
MGFCVIKYSEGYMDFALYGGTSTLFFPILPLLSRFSHPYSLRTVDARSQKCHRALVFVPCVCLGSRNVSCHHKISAIRVSSGRRSQGVPS